MKFSKLAGEGRFVLTASRATEPARDAAESGQASPFTRLLASALVGNAPATTPNNEITLDGVYDYIIDSLPTGGPTPEKHFKSAGRVPIARAIPQVETPGAVDDQEPELTSAQPASHLDRLLSADADGSGMLSGRRSGDISVGDVNSWLLTVAASVLAAAFAGISAKPDRSSYYAGPLPLPALVYSASSAAFGVIALLSAIDGFRILGLRAPYTRTKALAVIASSKTRGVRIARDALSIALAMILLGIALFSSADPRGPWVSTLVLATILALTSLLGILRLGDRAFAAGAVIVLVAPFVPVVGTRSLIIDGSEGLVFVIFGLLMLLSWLLRCNRAVLGFSALIATVFCALAFVAADGSMEASNVAIGLVGSLTCCVAVAMGCGRQLDEVEVFQGGRIMSLFRPH